MRLLPTIPEQYRSEFPPWFWDWWKDLRIWLLELSGASGGTIIISGLLPVANGGTNIGLYTVGDLIVATAATTLSRLTDTVTGNVLLSGGVGVIPAYGKVGLTTHVSGILPVANGGTASATGWTADLDPGHKHSNLWASDGSPEAVIVDASGKVLIGAASPVISAKLEVINTDWSISGFFGDPVDAQSDSVYIVGNTINGLYGMDDDDVALWVNYRGYHGGTTKYRDFIIGDGKEYPFLKVDASIHKMMVGRGGNPSHVLHVKDDGASVGIGIATNDADGEPYLSFYQTTTQKAYIQYNDQGVNPDYLEVQSDGHIYFNPTNYIGIGVASPDHPLHLVGAGYITGGLYVGANSTNNLIDDASNGAGSATLYIGNEAIATSSDISGLAGVYVDIAGDTMTGTLNLDDDNISIIWGAGQDAGISYDGTNLLINPKLVGSGYVNIKGQTLVDDKIMFTQTDGNEYIDSLADGYLDLGATTEVRLNGPATRVAGDLYIGTDAAVDPAIIMTGDTNDGQITWHEDENNFSLDAMLVLTNNLYLQADAAKAYYGTGDDMTIWYDGTDGNIKTSDVAASDLVVTCGAGKTIELANTVYDDLPPVPILSAKLGSTAPTLATFVTPTEQYTFDATNDYVIGSTEVTHKYKEGTDISAHIHWATNGVDAGDTGVKWQLDYTIANSDEAAPFSSAFGASVTLTIDTLIPGGTADRSHILSVFSPIITGTSVKIGAYIVWKLSRIASATAAPAADPFGLAVGFHVQMDTIGSRTVSTK